MILCTILTITDLSFCQQTQNQIGIVKVEDGTTLRMREYSSLDAEVVTNLKNGTEVIVKWGPVKESNNDWYNVIAPNGQEGWVSGKYLSITNLPFSFGFTEQQLFVIPEQKNEIPVTSEGIDEVKIEVFSADISYLSDRRASKRKAMQDIPLKSIALPVEDEQIILPSDAIIIPGLYIIRVSSSDGHPLDFIVLNSAKIGFVYKISPQNVLVYTVDLRTGEPKPCNIEIYQGEDKKKLLFSGHSDMNGLYIADTSLISLNDESIFIVAKSGDDYAQNPWAYYYWQKKDYTVYVYTDRPIYRPGNTVYFKGIVRKNGDGVYLPCSNKSVSVKIQTGATLVSTHDLTTNEFGTFSGEFTLDTEPKLSDYQIITTIDDESTDFSTSCLFKVREYRKPEYLVTVTTDKDTFISSEDITADVKAEYFFGGPVPNAQVKYSLYENSFWNYTEKESELDRKYEYQDYSKMIQMYGYPEGDRENDSEENPRTNIKEGTTTTDANGLAKIKISALGKLEKNKRYILLIGVSDESNREAIGSCKINVNQGAFSLDASTSKFVYRLVDTIDVTVNASEPVKDVSINLIAYTTYWMQKDSDWKEIEEPIWQGTVKTDSQGKANFNLNASKSGNIKIRLTSTDKYKNEINSYTYLCRVMSSDEQVQYNQYNSSDRFYLYAEKKVYSPGEKARIFIQSPIKLDNHPVLITVEGRKIHASHILRVIGTSATMEIPITQDYEPNVFISACTVKDVKFYTSIESQYIEDSYSEEVLKIYVPPIEKFLNIAINTDKPEYRPGDNATYSVKTTDMHGKPISSEVSLGVVDSSIYALQHELVPDIKRYFYGARGNTVYTDYSFNIFGGAEGGEGADDTQMTLRNNFPDTAFWQANLVTDENGVGTVSFKLPDNITSWRATTRGITADTMLGSETSEVISTKPMFIRLLPPRFLTQGDTISIPTIIHNYSPTEQDVVVKFQAQGVKLVGNSQKSVIISPNDSINLLWKVEVDDIGTAKFTATARSETLSDGIEMSIPILPHGIEQVVSISGSLDGSSNPDEESTLVLPKNRLKGASNLKLVLSPSLASTMFTALDYLVSYPYGCVEQTMGGFLPNIFVYQTLKILGIQNQELEKELPKMVEKGLQRLYNFQHEDGGWGWWEGDETHPFMTAYVIFGLSQAISSGFNVDDNVYKKGIESLKKQLSEPSSIKSFGGYPLTIVDIIDTQIYMLFALAMADSPLEDDILRMYGQADIINNNYSLSLLALALNKLGKVDLAKNVLDHIAKNAVKGAGGTYWKGSSWHYSWTSNQNETTAFAILALSQIDQANNDALISDAIRYLIDNRKGENWSSTKDTAAIIFAFSEYVSRSSELKPDYTVEVNLNEKLVKKIQVSQKEVFSEGIILNIPEDELISGDNDLQITIKGVGKLYYTASLKYFDTQPTLPSMSQGITIERSYSTNEAKTGEDIEVTLTIKSDADYQYAIIEDYLPSGCSVVGEGTFTGGSARKEIHDEKVAFLMTNISLGKKHELSYTLRPETSGDFVVLPTKAYLMYEPDVRGNSEESGLIVK
jgi:alpha-2-macroglobulin